MVQFLFKVRVILPVAQFLNHFCDAAFNTLGHHWPVSRVDVDLVVEVRHCLHRLEPLKVLPFRLGTLAIGQVVSRGKGV